MRLIKDVRYDENKAGAALWDDLNENKPSREQLRARIASAETYLLFARRLADHLDNHGENDA